MTGDSETFVTWKAFVRGLLAVTGIGVTVATIVITVIIFLGASHAARIHKGAVSQDSLLEHVGTARGERREIRTEGREERKAIISKMDHIETSIHSVEMEQAVMLEKLDNIYEAIQ